ncbi:MAG TPA: YetF domain-containing protein [Chitinophagaceae bacterium]|nr:YetF domain-containing protein [Chitinophagaceae bacterium]
MNEIINKLFGEGNDLNALQMADRAFVMFFITLFLIRIAGMRAFGQKSAFDMIIVIMLGAILSRSVTGASAFWPTIAAGAVLAVVHRILGLLSMYNQTIGWIVKGNKIILYKNDKMIKGNMMKCSISYKDLQEEVRLILNEMTMDNVEEIYMERSGKISVIKKKSSS